MVMDIQPYPLQKILMTMRLLMLLMLLSIAQVHAGQVNTETSKITLNIKNSTIEKILFQIEEKTNYVFVYNKDLIDVNRLVNIKSKGEDLDDVLYEIFSGQNVKFQRVNNNIIISPVYGLSLQQQELKITGKVMDKFSNPIAGANVYEKEAPTHGVITGSDGSYSITVSNPDDAILVFSFIGFDAQEIHVAGRKVIDVILMESSIALNEVVSIGYGSSKKTDLTGSIGSIRGDELTEHPITTLEQGMQGMVSGVQITQSSGQPGAGMSVTIRGVGSIVGGTQPLYVIDGIPMFNTDIRDLNGFSALNPTDIASIEILKDAAATAIYGSRAANGVILITTKSGKAKKATVDFNSYVGFQKVRKKLPLMNGEEYMNFAKDYFTNSDLAPGMLEKYIKEIDDYGNANTNWQDEIFRKAFQQNYNLSVSGGNEKNRYYFSTGYQGQDGIVKSTDFKRYSIRLNMDSKINKWLDIAARAVVSKVEQNGYLRNMGTWGRNMGKSGMGSVLISSPTSPVYDENGDYAKVIPYDFSTHDIENPIAITEALDRNTMYNYQGGFDINIKFFKGFTNKTRLGLNYTDRKYDSYYPKFLEQLGSQTAILNKSKRFNIVLEDFMTYKTTFADNFNLEIVAGASIQDETTEFIGLSGVGFPSDILQNNAMQAATSQGVSQTNIVESSIVSFFGRAHMDYLNKYLLSFNIRYDGASVFAPDNKWAVFPAIALGWRISEEDFFDVSWFSNLKLRGSWGQTGNQAIRPYQSLFIGRIVNTPQGFGAGVGSGIAPNLPNQNLTWETTNQLNIGIDLGFINNKIRSTFDYYVKTTKDLLANVQLPQSAGFRSITDNVGEVENKGFEFSIGADIVNSANWKFSADLNISSNKNKVLNTYKNKDIFIETEGLSSVGSKSIVRVGEPLFSFFTNKYLGMDENGQPIYEDLNGDGKIDANDNQVVGSPYPNFIGGLNLNLSYKRISLTMLWQGVSGNLINNKVLSRLVAPNPNSNKMISVKEYYPVPSNKLEVKSSDRFIEDGSYLRMKNIKLSYDVPVKKDVLNRLTIYVTGMNLITFTNYSGYDPEVNSFSNVNQYTGVDGAAYPSSKTFIFGVNVSF